MEDDIHFVSTFLSLSSCRSQCCGQDQHSDVLLHCRMATAASPPFELPTATQTSNSATSRRTDIKSRPPLGERFSDAIATHTQIMRPSRG
jgi:hypothetical protein